MLSKQRGHKEIFTMDLKLRPATADEKDFCRQVHHLAYRDVVERQFGRWDESQQEVYFNEGVGCVAAQHHRS